jgi:hypothetical protein
MVTTESVLTARNRMLSEKLAPKWQSARDPQSVRSGHRIVDRPQKIENDAALSFFGGSEGDAAENQR